MSPLDRATSAAIVPSEPLVAEVPHTTAPESHRLESANATVPELDTLPPLVPAPAPYSGRPVIPGLSAITLRVRASVLSGPAPLPVQVTMLECGWTGPTSGSPYEDLEFTVDFGDGSGPQRFTDPTTGNTVNPNSDQVGPEALYVYQTPGTYTITVTARGWNGTQFITASTTAITHAATVTVWPLGATQGTFTLRVQQNRKHARSASFPKLGRPVLARAAGHAIMPASEGFMFAGWFSVKSATNTYCLGANWDDAAAAGSGRAWRLQFVAGSCKLDVARVGTTSTTSVTSVETGLDTGWHYVVGWCDVAGGQIGISIDGGTPTTAARPANPVPTPATPFALGGYQSTTGTIGSGFNGQMDEVAFWNRPPQAGELAWLYNGGAGRHYEDVAVSSPPASLTTGMVAWWSLDEPFGPLWSDSTGNGNTLEEGVQIATNVRCDVAIGGMTPKVYRPGGVETVPIAFDAHPKTIALAIANAVGLTSEGDVYRDGPHAIRFGGAASGQEWTLAPGTLAGGFNGTLGLLGESDAATSTAITVTEWDTLRYRDLYFDPDAPAGGNGTAASPYNTFLDLRTALTTGPGGIRANLKAGATFVAVDPSPATAGMTINVAAPVVIQKWGSGSNPVLDYTTSGSSGVLSLNMPADTLFRWFILNGVDIRGNAGRAVSPFRQGTRVSPGPRHLGFYLINSTITTTDFTVSRVATGDSALDCVGLYGGSISGPGGITTSKPSNVIFDSQCFGAVLGTSISGGGIQSGSGQIYCHHIYWSDQGSASLARWVRFGAASIDPSTGLYMNLNFCIKGNAFGDASDPVNGPPITRRGFLVDSCEMTGTNNACSFSRHNHNELLGNAYRELVMSRNRIYRSANVGTQWLGPLIWDAYSFTARDNVMWNIGALDVIQSTPDSTSRPDLPGLNAEIRIYRNRILADTALLPQYKIALKVGDVGRLEVSDNIFMKTGTNLGVSGICEVLSWDALAARGSNVVFARNQYWFPDQPDTKVFRDDNPRSTSKSLAQWQANGWDTDVVVADPGWANPRVGDFSTTTLPPTPPPPPPPTPAVTYAVTAPQTMVVGQTSPITITPSASVTGVRVTLTFSGLNGQSASQQVMLNGAGPSSVSYQAVAAGTLKIDMANDGGLPNPSQLAVVIKTRKRSQPPRITPQQLQGGRAAKWRRAGR